MIETIEMPLEEYEELTKVKERLAVVERLIKKNSYISFEDLLVIMNIE